MPHSSLSQHDVPLIPIPQLYPRKWPQRNPTPRSGPGAKTLPHHGSGHGVDQVFVGQHRSHWCGSPQTQSHFSRRSRSHPSEEKNPESPAGASQAPPSRPPPPEQPLPGRRAGRRESGSGNAPLALIGSRWVRGAEQRGAGPTKRRGPTAWKPVIGPRVSKTWPVVLRLKKHW